MPKGKLIRFNGTLYASASKMIEANRLQVRALYDHSKERHKLEYRVYDGETFTTVTKYQAKRHLNEAQQDLEKAFGAVVPLFRKDTQFNKKTEIGAMVKADKESGDMLYWTMYEVLSERSFSYQF